MPIRLTTQRGLVAAAVALAALTAAGCSGSTAAHGGGAAATPAPSSSGSSSGGGSGSAGRQVTIAGTNGLKFSPMTVHVPTGKVRITLTDQGAYPHNLVIPSLHVKSATVSGDPGEDRTTVTVRFPHAGRYSFYCQYHRTAGMTGVFVAS